MQKKILLLLDMELPEFIHLHLDIQQRKPLHYSMVPRYHLNHLLLVLDLSQQLIVVFPVGPNYQIRNTDIMIAVLATNPNYFYSN